MFCPVCGAKLKVQGVAFTGKNRKKYICSRCGLVIKGDTCYFVSEGDGNLR